MHLGHSDGPGGVEFGQKRGRAFEPGRFIKLRELDNGRDYRDTAEPQWKRVRDAVGQSVLSALKKAGKKIAKSTAKRLLKLAMARLRLKMRTGPLVNGAKRTYRTWQAAQIADKLADSAEALGNELLDAAESVPDKRKLRVYQKISTTRASRTMPFWDKGSFSFGGRAALRLRPGRPPLTAEEWQRRYRARRKLSRSNATLPPTKHGRPKSPLAPASPAS
jgi:hypothetical protein